jgi:hypothetical protein
MRPLKKFRQKPWPRKTAAFPTKEHCKPADAAARKPDHQQPVEHQERERPWWIDDR